MYTLLWSNTFLKFTHFSGFHCVLRPHHLQSEKLNKSVSYVYQFCQLYAISFVTPFVEKVSQSVPWSMENHSFQEILFKVFFSSSDPQIVNRWSYLSSGQSVYDMQKICCTELLRLHIFLMLSKSPLLPFVKSLGKIKLLHSTHQLFHSHTGQPSVFLYFP